VICDMTLLHVKDLYVTIDTMDGPLEIIKGIDFSINKGDRLGIVGESGCGKSITSLAILGLLPDKSGVSGQILLDKEDIALYDDHRMCSIRGDRIGMIFQEPMTALNPVKTIGDQIAESLILHTEMGKHDILHKVEELMDSVGLPVNRFALNLYPHQLSGGQRQRVMIAIAIACKPDILIADEPTTALDVTVQMQVLKLIIDLADKSGMALIIISHDLGVIAQTTGKVMVMYTGKVMEKGLTSDLFKQMSHPYTHGLFNAIPQPGSSRIRGRKRLFSIPGHVPDPRMEHTGCVFVRRCIHATDICWTSDPPGVDISPGHRAWCFHPVFNRQEE